MEDCERCNGTGWVLEDTDQGKVAKACPVCRVAARARKRLDAAHIPPRYLDRGFDLYSTPHPSQVEALKRAVDYVEAYPAVTRGLLLVGPCGVGKTHLAVAVLKALVQEKSVLGRFVDETELLRRLQFSYRPDSPDTEREVLIPLMEAELLVWDDLGTGRPTDWVRETVGMILNYRYTNNRQTVMTTNLPLRRNERDPATVPTLEERIGVRLHSRILEMCEVVEISGPDYRRDVHKAGMDFRSVQKTGGWKVPPGLLRCPTCDSPKVSFSPSQGARSGSRKAVELACSCGACGAAFNARFSPATAKIELL